MPGTLSDMLRAWQAPGLRTYASKCYQLPRVCHVYNPNILWMFVYTRHMPRVCHVAWSESMFWRACTRCDYMAHSATKKASKHVLCRDTCTRLIGLERERCIWFTRVKVWLKFCSISSRLWYRDNLQPYLGGTKWVHTLNIWLLYRVKSL